MDVESSICLSDLVPALRWSRPQQVAEALGDPRLPTGWWSSLALSRALGTAGLDWICERLARLAASRWDHLPLADLLPALTVHQVDPAMPGWPEATRTAVTGLGGWHRLRRLTPGDLVMPSATAEVVIGSVFREVLGQLQLDASRPAAVSPVSTGHPEATRPLLPRGTVPGQREGAAVQGTTGPAQPEATPQTGSFSGQPGAASPAAGLPARGVPQSGSFTAQPSSGGYPAQPEGAPRTGGYPGRPDAPSRAGGHAAQAAQPDGGPQTGGFPALPGSASQTGGFPAQPGSPSQTGGFPAVPGSASQTGATAQPGSTPQTGGYPARPGATPQTGGFPSQPASGPRTGGYAAQPGSDSQSGSAPSTGSGARSDSASQTGGLPAQPGSAPQTGGFPAQPGSTSQTGGFPAQPGPAPQTGGFRAQGEGGAARQTGSFPAQSNGLPQRPTGDRQKADPLAGMPNGLSGAPHTGPLPSVSGAGAYGGTTEQAATPPLSDTDHAMVRVVDSLFRSLDKLELAVAVHRLFAEDPISLRTLAHKMLVDRDVLSQAQRTAEERVLHWLRSSESAPVTGHMFRLTEWLGAAATEEQLIGADPAHPVMVPSLRTPLWRVLVTLMPDRRLQDGWLVIGDLQRLQARTRQLLATRTSDVDVVEVLSELGIRAHSAKAWLDALPPESAAHPTASSQAPAQPLPRRTPGANGHHHRGGQPIPAAPAGSIDPSAALATLSALSGGRSPILPSLAGAPSTPPPPLPSPSSDPRRWQRIEVTPEHLRGGPVPVPEGYATQLGMRPGTLLSVTGPGDNAIVLVWQGHQPVFDSLQPVLMRLNARPGDQVYVTVDGYRLEAQLTG
ncbi:hypothetical protein [Nonomuraea cavernae]|uniref:Uncharacterized protein n=1 Tax=Nonomuraea cavernae TaxID=2045107 RepID=A0A917Z6K5_9ACTN|nr:hypothetical protein [Nonomuraea cavernae]MCA2189281.1 hypothetical protein [Nonomuraea cavernae]GGO76500.1 hypothetical protein GCM10012289_53980 [Nonomuraea cavernae]